MKTNKYITLEELEKLELERRVLRIIADSYEVTKGIQIHEYPETLRKFFRDALLSELATEIHKVKELEDKLKENGQ